MRNFDWHTPQRQPLAGVVVILVNTFWEVIKRMWPVLLLPLLRRNPDKSDRFEIYALIILSITILIGLLKFFFFRFYLENENLIIKKGWWKKETKIIPLEKIQTVNIEQGPVHQVLKIVKLSIDTAGSQTTEAVIDALHKPMADALREKLLTGKHQAIKNETAVETKNLVLQLTDKDLVKLSLSANHLETFFIILAFVFGLIDNLNMQWEEVLGLGRFLPAVSLAIISLSLAVLLITVLVSTGRIFFNFYDFRIFKIQNGLQIHSGLINVKEKIITFNKIQYLSLKANWIRKILGMWMLEYFVAGGVTDKKNARVQIPVTRNEFIPELINHYHSIENLNGHYIRIHPSYKWRRLLSFGIFPAAILIAIAWPFWQEKSLYFLLLPFYVGLTATLIQKKFKFFAFENAAYVRKGVLGEEKILFKWHKLQSVRLNQSIYQRRKGLATVKFYTAGGVITVPFIALPAAKNIVDFALVKLEFSKESWL